MEKNTQSRQGLAGAIADYLRSAYEHPCGECLGFELEHFIVEAQTGKPVPYAYKSDFDTSQVGKSDTNKPDADKPGVGAILEKLLPYYDKPIWESSNEGIGLIGLLRVKAVITLEPGAQIEISAGPCQTVAEVEEIYRQFLSEIDPILTDAGYALVTSGYHPQACAEDIPLIPKDRYDFMNRQFATTGKHGICMMRASASCQVSVDYFSEADAVLKMRVAAAIGPLMAFLTDSATIFEGKSVFDAALEPELKSKSGLEIPTGMARMAIWDDVDADRCLLPPGLFDEDFGFDSYARTLLTKPAIFIPPTHGTGARWADGATFAGVFAKNGADRYSPEIIEHILSLFFYDVRFKRYIEIRQADSMPMQYALAYTALIKGLFYQPEAVAELGRQFAGLNESDVAQAKQALRRDGYDALVYGRRASAWLEALQVLAGYGLSPEEAAYLEPLGDLISERQTLLDKALGEYRA